MNYMKESPVVPEDHAIAADFFRRIDAEKDRFTRLVPPEKDSEIELPTIDSEKLKVWWQYTLDQFGAVGKAQSTIDKEKKAAGVMWNKKMDDEAKERSGIKKSGALLMKSAARVLRHSKNFSSTQIQTFWHRAKTQWQLGYGGEEENGFFEQETGILGESAVQQALERIYGSQSFNQSTDLNDDPAAVAKDVVKGVDFEFAYKGLRVSVQVKANRGDFDVVTVGGESEGLKSERLNPEYDDHIFIMVNFKRKNSTFINSMSGEPLKPFIDAIRRGLEKRYKRVKPK